MKSLCKILTLVLLVCGVNNVNAQSSLKNDAATKIAEVKTLVNSDRYRFKLEKAILKTADTTSAPYGTGMDISKDTLIVYLPGLGKEPGAPVNANEAGITCIHFAYNMTAATDGGYDVSIIPDEKYAKDVRNIKTIGMHISKVGYADVKVSTTDQGTLQYHGYIMQHGPTFPNRIVSD